MSVPESFAGLPLDGGPAPATGEEPRGVEPWTAPEGIEVKPLYTALDVELVGAAEGLREAGA